MQFMQAYAAGIVLQVFKRVRVGCRLVDPEKHHAVADGVLMVRDLAEQLYDVTQCAIPCSEGDPGEKNA